nr:hypothetical protein [Tanacetum cinerariifolium]
KKCTVNAEVFRTILDIYLRVEGEDFIDVPDDETALNFLIDFRYKGPLNRQTNMLMDHIHQPWRTLAVIIKQEAAHIMQALTKSKKTSRRQPSTGGSNKGTDSKPGVPNESKIVSATLSEGTSVKPREPNEDKDITEKNVILEWGDEQNKKDVSQLKTIDHSSKALAVLQSYVPTVVDIYLDTKVGDAAFEEYDLNNALYQSMHANKSFNKNPANHRLYHAHMEALIEDENAMDKGVTDTVKDHKRKHDDGEDSDDEDPPAGPNHESALDSGIVVVMVRASVIIGYVGIGVGVCCTDENIGVT